MPFSNVHNDSILQAAILLCFKEPVRSTLKIASHKPKRYLIKISVLHLYFENFLFIVWKNVTVLQPDITLP